MADSLRKAKQFKNEGGLDTSWLSLKRYGGLDLPLEIHLSSVECDLLQSLAEVSRRLDEISIHSDEYAALSRRSLELNQHLGTHLVLSARMAFQEASR